MTMFSMKQWSITLQAGIYYRQAEQVCIACTSPQLPYLNEFHHCLPFTMLKQISEQTSDSWCLHTVPFVKSASRFRQRSEWGHKAGRQISSQLFWKVTWKQWCVCCLLVTFSFVLNIMRELEAGRWPLEFMTFHRFRRVADFLTYTQIWIVRLELSGVEACAHPWPPCNWIIYWCFRQ
jgi:hypothetical protein